MVFQIRGMLANLGCEILFTTMSLCFVSVDVAAEVQEMDHVRSRSAG